MRIDELISATKSGSFQWRAINPTTYLWEKRAGPGAQGARLTLQRVEQNVMQPILAGRPPQMVRQSFVILQAVELEPTGIAAPKLSFSGQTDSALNAKLQQLFDLASSVSSQQGLDFLKKLLAEEH